MPNLGGVRRWVAQALLEAFLMSGQGPVDEKGEHQGHASKQGQMRGGERREKCIRSEGQEGDDEGEEITSQGECGGGEEESPRPPIISPLDGFPPVPPAEDRKQGQGDAEGEEVEHEQPDGDHGTSRGRCKR